MAAGFLVAFGLGHALTGELAGALTALLWGGLHHNHHAFPRSARHGLRWWEIDPGGLVIGAMKRLRLAWNVVRITPERQAQKLGPAASGRRLDPAVG